jgi:hypothetical protein
VEHCLKRLVYADEATINTINQNTGIFSVKSETNNCYYKVHFNSKNDENIPSCECLDWQKNYLPCKHILSVIHANNEWEWSNLPACYRESPYLTIDSEVIFKQVSDTKNENDDHTPNTLNLDEQELKGNNFAEEKRSIDIKDIPKPTFPKRTSVTRCCDLLAKIKGLVHECTKSTALEKLEKDLKLALKDFESNIREGTTTSRITLSAPDRRTVPQRKRKNQEQKQANTACPLKKRKMKKSTLPAVKPKKVHPFNKRSGQHAQMMRKYYRTNMSIEEMMGTEIMRQTDNASPTCQMPQKSTYINFTPTIREGSPLTTTMLRNGPHSLSLLQLKSLEPFLPRGTAILLKAQNEEFKPGWLFDEVLNSYFWLLQENHQNVLYAPSTSMLALQKGLSCGRLWKGEVLTNKDFIFAPWNPTNYHWTLVAIDLQHKQILYLDPMINVDVHQNGFAQLLSTFMPQMLERTFGLSGFEIGSLPHTLQTDSINCGVLVCWYAMRLVNGKSLTDWCNTSVMRITIYKQIRGTCLQRRSGCRHIELSKCPICKVELQMGDTRFQCRRCCQSYHSICLIADQKPPVKEQSNEWVFYCPPIHVTLGGQVHQS